MAPLTVMLIVCWWLCMRVATRDVGKCCSKGEQLDPTGLHCVPLFGGAVTSVERESLSKIKTDDPESLYWLPAHILNETSSDLNVKYGYFERIREKDVWIVHLDFRDIYNFRLEFTSVSFNSLSNDIYDVNVHGYCIDLRKGFRKSHVLVLCTACRSKRCIDKCCPVGMILSRRQGELTCVESEDRSWSPGESNLLKGFESATRGVHVRDTAFALCPTGRFGTLEEGSSGEAASLVLGAPQRRGADVWHACADWEAHGDGGVREAVARCALPLGRPEFASELARPLCASASVLLLLGALASLGARRVTRCTPHGCALACHALALLAANASQIAAWATGGLREYYCTLWEHLINYFSMVAAFWLNIICCNVAFGFRRAVSGAATAARGAAAERGCGCERRRCCWCCGCGWRLGSVWFLFGWALPSLVALILYLSPPLYNNSTITLDSLSRICKVQEGYERSYAKLGTFLHFYLPLCVLVALNFVSFAYTSFKIHQLSRGGSIIEGREDARALRRRKSALVYVKLLLTTGVLEVCLEVAAWTVHDDVFIFRATAAVLDLARAAAILWLCACRRRNRRRRFAAALSLALARALARLRPLARVPRRRSVRPEQGINMEELSRGKNALQTSTS